LTLRQYLLVGSIPTSVYRLGKIGQMDEICVDKKDPKSIQASLEGLVGPRCSPLRESY
jgi:hypothetical protein